MSSTSPTLHMMCGKMAAGKSTLAAQLVSAPETVLLAEDDWLSALYGDQMRTGADYVRYSAKLRAAMAPHVVMLLKTGLSVVLDFAANTVAQRAWMRTILASSQADHVMHVLTASDAVCLARLKARNAAGDHAFAPTEDQFRRFARFYVEPGPDEGFNVRRHP